MSGMCIWEKEHMYIREIAFSLYLTVKSEILLCCRSFLRTFWSSRAPTLTTRSSCKVWVLLILIKVGQLYIAPLSSSLLEGQCWIVLLHWTHLLEAALWKDYLLTSTSALGLAARAPGGSLTTLVICVCGGPLLLLAPLSKPGRCLAAAALGSAGQRWCGSATSRPLSAAATGWMASRCSNASLCRQMRQGAGCWSSRWGSGWSTWASLSTRASCSSTDLTTCASWWVVFCTSVK